MAENIEFEWDEHNRRHLKNHRVSPQEFEQVIANGPFDLEYQTESGEERYKSIGITDKGRVLVAVWMLREEKVRAITAYPAGRLLERFYWEKRG
ncbi:MAG: BrnT family toxin [Acidobacteria bacterium]|nr:BrnT family toxin [Acidobacteriota bacterium]